MKEIGTYVLIGEINKKFYIGSTNNFKYRMNRHFNHLKKGDHPNILLQHIFNSGENIIVKFFKKETLEEARELELKLINRYLKSDKLINILIGVNGGDNITRNPNKDLIRKKLSLSRKGRVFSKETKLKISLARKKYFEKIPIEQRKHSEEVKNKRADSLRGKKRNKETKKRISESLKLTLLKKKLKKINESTTINMKDLIT